jgi:hypothetical protein
LTSSRLSPGRARRSSTVSSTRWRRAPPIWGCLWTRRGAWRWPRWTARPRWRRPSPHDPAELARRVASPGGVTQAGLDALDGNEALRRVIVQTLRAARDRSAQMASEARGKG